MNVMLILKFMMVDRFQLKSSGSFSLIRYEENLKFNPLFNWKPVQVL